MLNMYSVYIITLMICRCSSKQEIRSTVGSASCKGRSSHHHVSSLDFYAVCMSFVVSLQNRQLSRVESRAEANAASSPAATAVSTTIVLKQCELSFGDTVKAVGESDLFGCWDSSKGPELQWQEGHDWQAQLDVPCGDCSFKVAGLAQLCFPDVAEESVSH